jgi:hypothetical protein
MRNQTGERQQSRGRIRLHQPGETAIRERDTETTAQDFCGFVPSACTLVARVASDLDPLI